MTVALMTGLISVPASASGSPTADPPAANSGHTTVTLITGDQVLLDHAGNAIGVTPAKDRSDIPLQISRTGDHTYVVPADAEALLGQGKLDLGLFDVTELIRPEYRDLAHDGAPILVRYSGQNPAARGRLHAGTEATVRDLSSLHTEAVVVSPNEASTVWAALTDTADGKSDLAPGVAELRLDRVMTAALDVSVPQIGAPSMWQSGFDGTGVKVAVLDTGIDTSHPDFAGRVVAERNFSTDTELRDGNGHGTHVASTAAGTGAGSDGKYKGVAPGADLVNGKVLNTDGSGLTSGIVDGVEWAVAQGADVINMSLGATDKPGTDPLEEAVNAFSDQALFVIAAGNSGSGAGTVGTPGVAESALTVGAVDKLDGLADFSSRGPRPDGGVKPDVTAPGVAITAASAAGTRPNYPHPVPGYVTLDGTSMATPHVAGAAALLMQQHPDWSPGRIKSLLTGSAKPGGYTAYEQGAGRVDLTRASTQTVVVEPASLNFGEAEWPHTDDEPQSRMVVYRNLGDQPVTLDLTATTLGPDGGPAPAGLLTLGSQRITVSAGGTAGVDVTADTRVGGEATGAYALTVVATGGDGLTIRSVGGLERAADTHEVTIRATGRDGLPPDYFNWAAWFTGIGNDVIEVVRGENGTATVELPTGDYIVAGRNFDDGGIDTLVAPKVRVDHDMTLTFDARDARPVEVTVPDPGAVGYSTLLTAVVRSGEAESSLSVGLAARLKGDQVGTFGPAPAPGEVTSYLRSNWYNGATEYHIAHTLRGAFYSGHIQHVTARQLARLTLRQGASVPGALGMNYTVQPGPGGVAIGHYSDLPGTRTVYVQGGYAWSEISSQVNPNNGSVQTRYEIPARTYLATTNRTETVGVGVFGPALAADGGLVRNGDRLTGRISSFTDGAGHTGSSLYDAASASTTLLRNGKPYATADGLLDAASFTLPPVWARYKLVTTVRRAAGISSVTSAVTWQAEFTSSRTSSPTAVPASVVRYTPDLALDSTAVAGKRQTVPVTLQGSAAGRGLAALKVSVSYDAGKTWHRATVRHNAVSVTNPPAGGTVSLRAEVKDRHGNTFSQIIVDAYRTK